MAVHKPGLSYFADVWNAGISTPEDKKEEALKWINPVLSAG